MEVNASPHALQLRKGRRNVSWPSVTKSFKRGVVSSTREMSPSSSSCPTGCVASSLSWGNIGFVLVLISLPAGRQACCYMYGNHIDMVHLSSTIVRHSSYSIRSLAIIQLIITYSNSLGKRDLFHFSFLMQTYTIIVHTSVNRLSILSI